MNYEISVDDRAFEYLRIQKGNLDGYTHRRAEWQIKYEADIRATFEQIARWLPPGDPVERVGVLDVGSGLGGIDVLIRRHYERRGETIALHLLDGIDDAPVMNLHRETFNDMAVALGFQEANGLGGEAFRAWDAMEMRSTSAAFDCKFDLVVSFGSWCFHYPPSVYLKKIYRALAPGAVVILDVRRHKLEWMGQLEAPFDLITIVNAKPKWSRCVFKVRQTR